MSVICCALRSTTLNASCLGASLASAGSAGASRNPSVRRIFAPLPIVARSMCPLHPMVRKRESRCYVGGPAAARSPCPLVVQLREKERERWHVGDQREHEH